MAQKIHQLALEIQGSLDSSFVSAMKDTQGYLQGLQKDVKDYQEQSKKISGTEAAYVKTSVEARNLGQTILDLRAKQADVSGYMAQKEATKESASAYSNAKRKLQELTTAQNQDKKAIRAAKTEVDKLEKAHKKDWTTLGQKVKRLQEAKVDVGNLTAEEKRLGEELEQATGKQEKFNASLEKLAHRKAFWADMASGAKEFGHKLWQVSKWAAAGAASLAAMGLGVAKSTADHADAIRQNAQKIGMGVEAYQELAYAAKMEDLSEEKFGTGMKKFSQSVAGALKGNKDMVAVFKSLGISTKELKNNLQTPEILLGKLADQFQKAPDSMGETAIAMKLFGKSGADMIPFLNKGAEGIQDLRERGRELIHVFNNQEIEDADSFNDSIDELKTNLGGIKDAIGVELLPFIRELIAEFNEWLNENKGQWLDKFRDWIRDLSQGDFKATIQSIADTFTDWLNTLKEIIDAVGGVKNAIGGLAFLKLGGGSLLFKGLKAMLGAGPAIAGTGGAASAGAGMFGWLKGLKSRILPYVAAAHVGKSAGEGIVEGIVNPNDFVGEKAGETKRGKLASAFGSFSEKASFGYFDAGNVAKGMGEWLGLDWLEMHKNPDNPNNVNLKELERIAAAMTNPEERRQFVEAALGIERAIKEQPPIEVQVNIDAESINERFKSFGRHARGGLISSPSISWLAERGPEEIVPLGEADRGLGVRRLMEAASKLHVPMFKNSEETRPQSQISRSIDMSGITFAPVFQVTGVESNDIAQSVLEKIQAAFPQMLKNAAEEMERTAYGTT